MAVTVVVGNCVGKAAVVAGGVVVVDAAVDPATVVVSPGRMRTDAVCGNPAGGEAEPPLASPMNTMATPAVMATAETPNPAASLRRASPVALRY
jgi:hypothetical protein